MENKYVKSGLDAEQRLTLAIKRNGVDIELTREEISEIANVINMHDKITLVREDLDILLDDKESKYAGYFTREDLQNYELFYEILRDLPSRLGEVFTWWDEFYEVAYSEIDEYIKNNPRNYRR